MKSVTLFILLSVWIFMARATTFIIAVSDNQFSPDNIPNVVVGDVIKFNFAPFNFHNATTTPLGSVPAGAADIFSGNPGAVTTSYSYTVTHAGVYFYYFQKQSLDGLTGLAGTIKATGSLPVYINNFVVRL
jgi:plastocyanin